MDELDHMYEDMQDRLYEIDKNRKVNPWIKVGNQYNYLHYKEQIFFPVIW